MTSASPIVGRERERAHLRHLLDEAIAGNGRLVLVSGEAGIGKTTLVDDLIHEARQRTCLVLTGGCYDLTTTPPYGPWNEAIRDYQPSDGQPALPSWFADRGELERVGSQTALFEETRRFFTGIAKQQALVITLEDLHWADTATLEALRHLARTLGEAAILLVVTYRDDEITRRHELYQLLPLLVRESQAQRLHLNRLTDDAVLELVRRRYALGEVDVARLVAHVTGRSEGNPLFASEILQGLEDGQILQPSSEGWRLGDLAHVQVPALVRQVIDLRFSRLSDETRAALQTAAVIGQTVPLDLWQIVGGLEQARLDRVIAEALEDRILDEAGTGDAFQFRHALLRESLYESLILSRRRSRHRQVGEALSATPNPDPDAVAHHFKEAGDPRAAPWLIRAGLRAERSHALLMAVRHYETAEGLLGRDAQHLLERGWLCHRLGRLLRYTNHERGRAYLDSASQIAAVVSDPVLAAYSLWDRGLLHIIAGDMRRGLAGLEAGTDAVDSLSAADRARVVTPLSIWVGNVFSPDEDTMAGGLRMPGVLPEVNFQRQMLVHFLATAGRSVEAVTIGEDYLTRVRAAHATESVRHEVCYDAYEGLSIAYGWLGQPSEARRWFELAYAANEAIGHHGNAAAVLTQELLFVVAYRTDQLAERKRLADAISQAVKRAGDSDWSYAVACVRALVLAVVEGRWEEGRELMLADRTSSMIRWWLVVLSWQGKLARYQGQPAEAWAQVRAVLPNGRETEPGERTFQEAVEMQRLAVALSLDAGDLAAAWVWLDTHHRWLDWSGAVLGQAEGQLLWARYHQAAGDLALARQHADQALAHACEPRQPLTLLASHRFLGRLNTLEARHDDAQTHLGESLALAKACAAPFERALTLLEFARLRAAQGQTDETHQILNEVRTICEPLQARPALEQVAAVEAQLQEQPRAAVTPFGLTPRELDVLRLVAEGLTDPEVAERLYVSPRTVSSHLTSVYTKLGVSSRAAATRIAVEHRFL